MTYILMFALAVLCVSPAYAESSAHHEHGQNTVVLKLSPALPLAVGQSTQVTAKLSRATDNAPITSDDLKVVHTKKIHLLVIDPSLTDYHHIHPEATVTAGEYTFDFTPLKAGAYRAWADVTPVATSIQEYVPADMGVPSIGNAEIDKTITTHVTVDGYTFELAMDAPLKVGQATLATITVTKDGKPVENLQPLLGAFAHVVGFNEDFHTVLHAHPLGAEPESESSRGGSKLEIHLQPEHTGFYKLFAQVRINDKIIFAPFCIEAK